MIPDRPWIRIRIFSFLMSLDPDSDPVKSIFVTPIEVLWFWNWIWIQIRSQIFSFFAIPDQDSYRVKSGIVIPLVLNESEKLTRVRVWLELTQLYCHPTLLPGFQDRRRLPRARGGRDSGGEAEEAEAVQGRREEVQRQVLRLRKWLMIKVINLFWDLCKVLF